MRISIVVLLSAAASVRSGPQDIMTRSPAEASAYPSEVQEGYQGDRAASAAYRVLDSAVAKGYAASVQQCFSDPTHGAMGYHHLNRAYVDRSVEIEKPEILLYE